MDIGADSLPREVLVKIFSYLSREDLVNSVQFVCTWWQEVSWEKRLWKYIVCQPRASGKHVIEMLKISPQLRSLNLMFIHVKNNLIEYITDSCPNIEQLLISWDSIYNYEKVTITRPMNQIKILDLIFSEEIDLDFPYLHSTFPNLERLYISGLKFSSNDLASYLKKKQDSLHALSISCGTDDDLCVLPFLSECTVLRKLCVSGMCNKVDSLSFKEVGYLQNISHLILGRWLMNNVSDSSSLFCYLPNIIHLELHECLEGREDILRIIARNCPQLQKLSFKFPCYYHWNADRSLLRDATLKYAHHLERLTHLYIYCNSSVTDEGIKHLLLVPELIHLDLYECYSVTTACVKLICGFTKLEVLKFDLRDKQFPADLTASDVKNKNLQLLFYNCQDVLSLDSLKQQHLNVGLAKVFAILIQTTTEESRSWIAPTRFFPRFYTTESENNWIRNWGNTKEASDLGGAVPSR